LRRALNELPGGPRRAFRGNEVAVESLELAYETLEVKAG
jgi:hypothetical protein